MSKTRDIANFLGKTEAVNVSNAAIATDSNEFGVYPDTAYIENKMSTSGLAPLSSLDSLPASSILNQGSMYFTKNDPRRIYISTGTGYYNVAAVNTAGTASFDSASYSMDSINGTATVVTLTGTDPDSDVLSYSFSFIPSNIVDSAITTSISDNVITLTAQDSAGSGTGVYNFKIIGAVSDTVNTFYDSADVQLVFQGTGTLTSSAASVNEGSSVTFNLPAYGYADGTTFAYTITGISGADISQGLTGNMTVSSEVASVTINVVADVTTEGSETITFSADGQSVNVTINDTSTGPVAKATGGTITFDGNDVIHTFTAGTSTFTPSTTLSCDYIVVGGGAHGGGWRGGSYALGSGGGGAGGYLAGTGVSISSAVSITVGAGSTYTGNTSPSYGGNTVVSGGLSLTAYGGGPGGSITVYNGSDGGYNGGSGGGGAGNYPSGSYSGGSGTSGQGNAGGTGVNFQNNAYTGGGGGGAGGAGGASSSRQGGTGGDGISNSISGTAVIYAAGGGGGCLVEQSPPSPVSDAENYRGQGGSSNTGGEGGVAQYVSFGGALGYGVDGQDGTTPGSGGGGAAQHSASASDAIAGDGADGIVIIRYSGI